MDEEKVIDYCRECKHWKATDDDEWCSKDWNVDYDEEQECFDCKDKEYRKEPMSQYDYEDYIGAWKDD